MKARYPYYVGNEAREGTATLAVTNKYSGKVATEVAVADDAVLDEAIAKAVAAEPAMRALRPYERQKILQHCVTRFEARASELADILCVEAGKPIRDAKGEVTRLIDTFRVAAEESTRMTGEVLPMEISARARGYTGMWKRVPLGACAFISPFNFPLNLVAHKVAPALAVGCPFVLKPASLTPVGALVIGEVLAETDLPKGAFSVLPATREAADRLVTDERLRLLSFTGSPDVGWDLKARAGKKKVTLELGGNAAVIVDEDTDLADAIPRIVTGAFYQSGQSCISVQRIFVHERLYDGFRRDFVAAAKALVVGDPADDRTFIGPIISEKEAARIVSWVDSAVAKGAKVLCGGGRRGLMVEATVLENVPEDEAVFAKEVFGPVAVLTPFRDFDEALRRVNDSVYGLQAGVFTRDLYKAQRAWDVLEVGGVLIGDAPSFRVDHMPYGGVKDSGLGREGIRFAMEDMTEIRLLAIRNPESV